MQAYSRIFESLQLDSSYVGDLTVYRIIAEIGELLERWFVKNTDSISTLGYIISGERPQLMVLIILMVIVSHKMEMVCGSHVIVSYTFKKHFSNDVMKLVWIY